MERRRQLHPFGPACSEACTHPSYYFAPLILPDLYRQRHEEGRPFSKDEIRTFAKRGLRQARERGVLSASTRAEIVSVRVPSDEDYCLALDHYVSFKCEEDKAEEAIRAVIEGALAPMNARCRRRCGHGRDLDNAELRRHSTTHSSRLPSPCWTDLTRRGLGQRASRWRQTESHERAMANMPDNGYSWECRGRDNTPGRWRDAVGG
jgi:hypothetical protein